MSRVLKIILFIGIYFSVTTATAGDITVPRGLRHLNNLSKSQKHVLFKAYNTGKIYNLGLTLAAIAWEESNFGRYNLNLSDGDRFRFKGSFSPYHILLHTLCKRLNVRTNWRASRVAEKLLYDLNYSTSMAIVELTYWQRYWEDKNNPWSHTVASYNAGHASYKSRHGARYLRRIRTKVKALKLYLGMKGIL